jgi:hypothetical protein
VISKRVRTQSVKASSVSLNDYGSESEKEADSDNSACGKKTSRVSPNCAAFDVLKGAAPVSSALGCPSHTWSHVGEHAELPLVKIIMVESLTAVGYSGHARALFLRVYK